MKYPKLEPMAKKTMDKMVNFRMDQDLFGIIEKLAKADRRLVSQMIRLIVEDYAELNQHRLRG